MTNITGIACVDDFLRRLGELSPDDWMRLGQFERTAIDDPGAISTAAELAAAILAVQRLDVILWYAGDAIETCAELAESTVPRPSRRTRELMGLARQAARRAVLALVARDFLPAVDFDVLYAPVAEVLAPRTSAA